jgi:DNA-binding MarR family transcriptional regulator
MTDDVELAAWRRLLTVHAELVDALDKDMREAHDLPLTWYEVLLYLHESETGRLRMSELADTLLLSRSAATRFIDRMERAGLVERHPSPEDRRGTTVAMTAKGRRRFGAAAPFHLAGIRSRFTAHLTADEAKGMVVVFDRVLGAVVEGGGSSPR